MNRLAARLSCDFRCLLRLDGQAKRKEHGARVKNVIFFFMSFSLSRSTCHSTHDTHPFSLDHLIRPEQHDCGIVRPICFAVFKLMTNSNLVGCSTGKSAGLDL